MPSRQEGVAPATQKTKAAAFNSFSRLVHTALALAIYASSFGFPTLARLASGGWQTLTGWDLNPLDSKANFKYGGYSIYSNAPGLAWRHCVLCLSCEMLALFNAKHIQLERSRFNCDAFRDLEVCRRETGVSLWLKQGALLEINKSQG
jgi:hypothetical protein